MPVSSTLRTQIEHGLLKDFAEGEPRVLAPGDAIETLRRESWELTRNLILVRQTCDYPSVR